MKKLTFCFAALLFCSFVINNPSLTQAERDLAVKDLTSTQTDFLAAVEGLTKAQVTFKASPDKWSILECMEHIVTTENRVVNTVIETAKQPANPEKRSEIKISDEQLLTQVKNRSTKVKTVEVLEPKGKYKTPQEAIKAFKEIRGKGIEYVKTTNDDLRNHVSPHPFFGMIDSYQWLLLTSAHQKRHTLQIEEIKADKNFPRN